MDSVLLVNYTGRKGAGPVFSYEMTRALIQNGYKVAAVISNQIDNIEKWEQLELDKLVKINTYNGIFDFLIQTFRLIARKKKICSQFHGLDIKAIYCPMLCPWTFIINGFFSNAKKIVTVHDPIHHSGTNLLLKLWPDNSIQNADEVIVLSEKFVNIILKKYNKDIKNVHVIPHGRFNYYKDNLIKKDIVSYPGNHVNFLFFGRICEYKGLKILAEAYRLVSSKLENVTLTVAGSGDFKPYVTYYENLPKLNIINRWFDENEIGNLFCGENILTIVPYIDATQSGVIPIAMEYNSPIIASNTGGLSEQVENGITGILFEPGDPGKLADAMLYLAKNREKQKELIENSKIYLEQLDWVNLAKKLSDIIEI